MKKIRGKRRGRCRKEKEDLEVKKIEMKGGSSERKRGRGKKV